MSILNIVKTVKEVHKTDIVMVKIEKFYQVYGKDAYIISYFFNYKLKKVEEVYMCGFPESSFNKVIAKLEEKKINYLVLDRRNNVSGQQKDVLKPSKMRCKIKTSKF